MRKPNKIARLDDPKIGYKWKFNRFVMWLFRNKIMLKGIDTILRYEQYEQYFVSRWLKPNDIVLEIGARYGVVSSCINFMLKNKSKQVSIEPDPYAHSILEENRRRTKSKFKICKEVLSNKPIKMHFTEFGLNSGVANNSELNTRKVPNITVKDFLKKYKMKFNVLVADCEGCLCKLFQESGDLLLKNIELVIFEQDAEAICDYNVVTNKLKELGFILQDCVNFNRPDKSKYMFQQVWLR